MLQPIDDAISASQVVGNALLEEFLARTSMFLFRGQARTVTQVFDKLDLLNGVSRPSRSENHSRTNRIASSKEYLMLCVHRLTGLPIVRTLDKSSIEYLVSIIHGFPKTFAQTKETLLFHSRLYGGHICRPCFSESIVSVNRTNKLTNNLIITAPIPKGLSVATSVLA